MRTTDPTFDGKYLAMTDEDKFPILVRRDSHPGVVRLGCCPTPTLRFKLSSLVFDR